jgi:tetratricopeptide (TPR) repeat protein
MSTTDAEAAFAQSNDLLFVDGMAWIPVEITERNAGFVKAWNTGAREWRENENQGNTGFFPMHDAWTVYEPVGFPGTPQITMPPKEEIIHAFSAEVNRFIEREIGPRASEMRGEIERSQGDPKLVNQLGVLYARYGITDKARVEFERANSRGEYLPALVNLGNLSFLDEDYEAALSYYNRARRVAPDHAVVVLAVARTQYALENYTSAETVFAELERLNPTLAEKYSYLRRQSGVSGRAAQAGDNSREVVWDEE